MVEVLAEGSILAAGETPNNSLIMPEDLLHDSVSGNLSMSHVLTQCYTQKETFRPSVSVPAINHLCSTLIFQHLVQSPGCFGVSSVYLNTSSML